MTISNNPTATTEASAPKPCVKCSTLAGFPVSHDGRQLVHSAFEMFLIREAKYNDPRNEEWDWGDVTDKWERHAFAAFRDLRDATAEAARLREALRQAAENNHSFHAINGNGDRIRLVECEVEACAAARLAMGEGE